ncbi:OmpP1/FadL family transporter [Abyssalbus ytuae]|uniref:Outer membrane protein transport protein n=1 Tax=Abyssalbus ytuae TaxID=2926907 RepID=A0A9E6ZRM3_9FLAO|nr:outer membrane protein transport protein [Abyssalbus ytuae]UOB17568.1 outer membrane protein transport protein [Abyssalbus ytuae]
MKRIYFKTVFFLFSLCSLAQTGHIMQGVGSVNMSMGGASTAQPIDISGTLYWNPAAISAFENNSTRFDIGIFFSSPELTSSLPAGMMGEGSPAVKGTTEDDRGISPLPSLSFVWGKEGSRHTFGASAFGISGFGVTFPEESNNPLNPDFNPTQNSNPLNYPQAAGGFGHIESDYMLLQFGFTWAYELSDKISIGLQPNFNYAALELAPNPIAVPSQTLGYPVSDKASAFGIGAQIGLFYDSGIGFKAGVSYKTTQHFGDFEFDSHYLDGSAAPEIVFNMDYPAILSLGLGYSKGNFDLALDYRFVDYENTDGFEASGWQIADSGDFAGYPTGSVNGFGWKNISILSAGMQYKGINKLPLRIGYTYSSNPINKDLTFFSIPATAIIKNAFQFGLSYNINDKFTVDASYHYGSSGGSTKGQILNPTPAVDFNDDGSPDGPWDAVNNPLGAIPGSEVSYKMTTSMLSFGISYNFSNRVSKE